MLKEGEPRLLLESVLLGIVGAFSAELFMWMLHLCEYLFLTLIAGYQPPSLTETGILVPEVVGHHGVWLIPIATTVGGLISGALVYRFAPEAEGHGTDTVVQSFHRAEGVIRARVSPIKLVASAITIGSGGSAGREGPIALITAGVSSVYASLVHHSEKERRLLLLVGMAAGLAAIFRTPMGTGVFAIEVLYGSMEFETGALLYTMASSAVAYAIAGFFSGWHPLFNVPPTVAPRIANLGWYVVLGAASGVVGTILPMVFYRVRDAFRALPIAAWMKPALGGLGVGLLALRLPQVLGGGYGWIQQAMNGQVALRLMIVLVFAKILAFSLTVSSGGSGGVFAPSLFVGAMLGGAFADLFHQPSTVFVIVGMASVFGAAARVPIATMLMVTEMAGGYHLLLPSGLAVMISYLLQEQLSSGFRYHSLYEGQVNTIADSPAHYLDRIKVVLKLLGKVNTLPEHNPSDLVGLLGSSIRLNLPKQKELTTGSLRSESPLAGRTVRSFYRALRRFDFELIGIVRNQEILLPTPGTILNANDRLLIISSRSAREGLARHLELVRTEERKAA